MIVNATSVQEFRKNLKYYSDKVVDNDSTLIITRPKNKNVVLISEKEYNALQETSYLLSSKANRKALTKSINQLNNNDTKKFAANNFFDDIDDDE